MEPLFRIKATNTLEEYKRWNFELSGKKQIILMLVLYLLYALLITRYLLLYKLNPLLYAVCMLFMAVLLLFLFLYKNKLIKTVYYSNGANLKCPIAEVSFYEQFLEINNERSYSKFFYEDIYTIKETKTNYYIMTALNQGIILLKSDCPPEFAPFLQSLKFRSRKP